MMLALLSLVVCLFVGIANERSRDGKTDAPLQKCILVCMVLITIFSGVMLDVGNYSTNAGSVLYAGVLSLQYLLMRRFGWEAGQRCVVSTMIGMAMLTTTMAVMGELAGADQQGRAYALVIDSSRAVTAASFVAFAIGQSLLVMIYRAARCMPAAVSYGINIAVVQAVDSVIFYPIAFGFDGMGLAMLLPGYIIKVSLGLLAMPLLVLVTRDSGDAAGYR